MASKKKKPISSEFNTIDVCAEVSKEAPAEVLTESDKIQAKAGTIDISISDEIKQKLDSVDRLADENAKYAEEVSHLQARIAEYIQEISDIKKQEQADSSAEIVKLKLEIDGLKSENARLRAELEDITKRNSKPIHGATPPPISPLPRLTPNCYRRRIIGEYPTWN